MGWKTTLTGKATMWRYKNEFQVLACILKHTNLNQGDVQDQKKLQFSYSFSYNNTWKLTQLFSRLWSKNYTKNKMFCYCYSFLSTQISFLTLPSFKIHPSNWLCSKNDGQKLIRNSELVWQGLTPTDDENEFVYSVRQGTHWLYKFKGNVLI